MLRSLNQNSQFLALNRKQFAKIAAAHLHARISPLSVVSHTKCTRSSICHQYHIYNYRSFHSSRTAFHSLPAHRVLTMPSLSPTMEAGTIAKWNVKEGEKFEVGQSICEVETDKATVAYDATEDGYIAKILVGSEEIRVGQPLMVVVEDVSDVVAFKNYNSATTSVIQSSPVDTPTMSAPVIPSLSRPVESVTPTPIPTNNFRIFASPYAKKLAKESGVDISTLKGSGPNGRIIAADVIGKNLRLDTMKVDPLVTQASQSVQFEQSKHISSVQESAIPIGADGVYSQFVILEPHRELAKRYSQAKQAIPHYYLSIDLNLKNILALRNDLNSSSKEFIGLLDLLIKAAGRAVQTVPDVNGSWMDTYIRRYEQVDVNLVVGGRDSLVSPVIRDVNSKGLSLLSREIKAIESFPLEQTSAIGTISIHNLGMFGVKSAAPVILPPQSCALAFGVVTDTVIPNLGKEGEDNWTIAPIITVTMSCDHRVVDGAVAAQYLQAYKSIVEDPITLLL